MGDKDYNPQSADAQFARIETILTQQNADARNSRMVLDEVLKQARETNGRVTKSEAEILTLKATARNQGRKISRFEIIYYAGGGIFAFVSFLLQTDLGKALIRLVFK